MQWQSNDNDKYAFGQKCYIYPEFKMDRKIKITSCPFLYVIRLGIFEHYDTYLDVPILTAVKEK